MWDIVTIYTKLPEQYCEATVYDQFDSSSCPKAPQKKESELIVNSSLYRLEQISLQPSQVQQNPV